MINSSTISSSSNVTLHRLLDWNRYVIFQQIWWHSKYNEKFNCIIYQIHHTSIILRIQMEHTPKQRIISSQSLMKTLVVSKEVPRVHLTCIFVIFAMFFDSLQTGYMRSISEWTINTFSLVSGGNRIQVHKEVHSV